MMTVSVDQLVAFNFRPHHAAVVVKYFQPGAPAPQVTTVMGLTEAEMKIMQPLVAHAERCSGSRDNMEQRLAKLEAQKVEELARTAQWFDRAQAILAQSRTAAIEDIQGRCEAVEADLTQHLVATQKAWSALQDSERQCLALPAETVSGIKQRTASIRALVEGSLGVSIPELHSDPCLAVTFAPALLPFFVAAEEVRSALVTVSLPPPHVALTSGLASAEHTTATGTGLTHTRPGQEAEFVITARDGDGQPRDTGGASFAVQSDDTELKCSVTDNQNGTYGVSYAISQGGSVNRTDLLLSVLLLGRQIKGSPFRVCVTLAQDACVACGDRHTVVLMADGTLRAFGNNGYGELGDGSTTQKPSAVTIPNLCIRC